MEALDEPEPRTASPLPGGYTFDVAPLDAPPELPLWARAALEAARASDADEDGGLLADCLAALVLPAVEAAARQRSGQPSEPAEAGGEAEAAAVAPVLSAREAEALALMELGYEPEVRPVRGAWSRGALGCAAALTAAPSAPAARSSSDWTPTLESPSWVPWAPRRTACTCRQARRGVSAHRPRPRPRPTLAPLRALVRSTHRRCLGGRAAHLPQVVTPEAAWGGALALQPGFEPLALLLADEGLGLPLEAEAEGVEHEGAAEADEAQADADGPPEVEVTVESGERLAALALCAEAAQLLGVAGAAGPPHDPAGDLDPSELPATSPKAALLAAALQAGDLEGAQEVAALPAMGPTRVWLVVGGDGRHHAGREAGLHAAASIAAKLERYADLVVGPGAGLLGGEHFQTRRDGAAHEAPPGSLPAVIA